MDQIIVFYILSQFLISLFLWLYFLSLTNIGSLKFPSFIHFFIPLFHHLFIQYWASTTSKVLGNEGGWDREQRGRGTRGGSGMTRLPHPPEVWSNPLVTLSPCLSLSGLAFSNLTPLFSMKIIPKIICLSTFLKTETTPTERPHGRASLSFFLFSLWPSALTAPQFSNTQVPNLRFLSDFSLFPYIMTSCPHYFYSIPTIFHISFSSPTSKTLTLNLYSSCLGYLNTFKTDFLTS